MSMIAMFDGASAFDQDLGWCVDYVSLGSFAFSGTPCYSTSCGVQTMEEGTCAPTLAPTASLAPSLRPTPAPMGSITGYVMTDSNIYTAAAAWLDDRAAAEATYGHISTWETGEVKDMSCLFSTQTWCGGNTAALSFNEDISDWRVDKITSMSWMFYDASAFDQDLGWCVDDDVNLDYAFSYSGCASTSCGVVRCPTKENNKEQTPVAVIAGAAAAGALLLAVGAFCFYRRRKASTMDKADEPSGSLPKSDPEPTEMPPTEDAAAPKDEEATAIAPEAEKSPQETLAEEPPPPPAKGWFGRAGPEPEPEEPPLSPFSALRAERERELKTLASP